MPQMLRTEIVFIIQNSIAQYMNYSINHNYHLIFKMLIFFFLANSKQSAEKFIFVNNKPSFKM